MLALQDTPRQSPLLGILKGAVIAIGALLPGISGGALCVIMGIYKPMMALLADPIHQFKKQIGFFWPIAVGMLVGTLGISRLLGDFLERSETAAIFLFIGLIVGTVPSLFREAGKEGRSIGSWVSMAVCAGAIFFSLFYVGKVICVTVEPNFWWYNFCGALWGMSLVIPGLTSSSVMMALGLYQPMLEGLARLDFLVLSACLPGMVLTILLLARLVSWFFRKHYSIAFHGIFGIVLASTLVIIPTSYVGAWEIVLSAVCCIGGFLLAYFMARLDRRIQENGRA